VGLVSSVAGDPARNPKETRMSAWMADIEQVTVANENLRTVVYTGQHTQLTLMCLAPGEDIGWERHGHLDQFLRVEQGNGRVDLGETEETVDESHEVGADWAVIVPAGTWHNLVNTGAGELKMYSLY